MSTWNKRAVQGALIRLDQTGMVKRFRARRKDAEDNWLTCIEVLREPRPEDHDNLKFRRQAAMDEAADEQSDEDVDGDTLMRDLEVDMLDSNSQEAHDINEDAGRIPPQWIPERLLSNTLYEMVATGGSEGWDSGVLRDRIVGKFWRRPMESYLTRLTDDWEKTQPPHVRHLALIRDTRNTQEKKFVHYVYRTYGNFQKAVDAGEVIWAGVSKPAPKQPTAAKGGRPKKNASLDQPIDSWGFRTLNSKDFLHKDGSGSLSECRTAIVHGRKYGPRWDNSLTEDIGYQKIETPKSERPKWTNDMSRSRAKAQLSLTAFLTAKPGAIPTASIQQDRRTDAATDSEDGMPVAAAKVMGLPKRKHEGLLTIEQRVALGLKPKGRLSKSVEDQIREHRKRTGDPVSIPDSVEQEAAVVMPNTVKHGPLMTKEERIAAGLPARGRLGQKIEDQIREQRGLPKSVEKVKKPRNRPSNEPALLSKQQRIQFGIIPHGRLPQSLMEGLREEREFDIALEQSKVLQAYLGAVKEKKIKAEVTNDIDKARVQTLRENDPSRELDQGGASAPILDEDEEPLELASSICTSDVEKRRVDGNASASQSLKNMRIERDAMLGEIGATIPTPPSTISAGIDETAPEQMEIEDSSTAAVDDETGAMARSSLQASNWVAITPPRQASPIVDLGEVDEKIRSIKEKYSNRSRPGLYVDPFAKHKATKGRPRNAFIATFRLAQLATLEWFTDDGSDLSRHPVPSSPIMQQDIDMEDQSAEQNAERDHTCSHQKFVDDIGAVPDALQNISRRDEDIRMEQSSTESDHGADTTRSDEQTVFGQTPATAHQHARPVASWNAINKPTQPLYLSPYAPSEPPEPTSLGDVPPGSDMTKYATEDNGDNSQIHGVFGPITETDTMSRSARKLAAYMGTKTGGGSQKMFRHKIIMQIIDLCNGVYPMHGEIGRPFITLWKQQYPTTPPPNSSTVLSNLRDMIADPRNGLKKLSFLIRLRQSAGLKKKDMVVYQHLTPTSPQVTRLAYKMANYSNTKAHQYYPEEIRHLVSNESFYVPMPVAPKDETVSLERLNPSLQNKIKEANLARRRRYYHKQKNEDLARDAQNAAVEEPLRQASKTDGQPRAKRTRLASLNDKNKRYRRAPLSSTPPTSTDIELESTVKKTSPPENIHGPDKALKWKEPLVASIVRHDNTSLLPGSETSVVVTQKEALIKYYIASMATPIVRFYATNGTFSTEFGLVRVSDLLSMPLPKQAVTNTITELKSKKRVRIIEPASQHPSKKIRVDIVGSTPTVAMIHNNSLGEESEESYSSLSSSSDEEEDTQIMQRSKAPAKSKTKADAKAKAEQRREKKSHAPTLLERLTGLTGDPNDPIYQPPRPKSQSQKIKQGWGERKKSHFNKQQRERKYIESQDPVDKFKKLFCTLVIASSFAGGDGGVDWRIVEKVHSTKGFNLAKTKSLWSWMQANMASQIDELAADFEARFLEAYEDNRIASIEDLATYDWVNLVRWAMHTCIYPELSLPVCREALQHFIVDLSSFEALDRPKWYREKIADRVRTQLQLEYPFAAPLHRSYALRPSVDEKELKGRSWIRANTATPQALYESKTAHEKLKTLGNPVLAKVVGEYVDRQMLRMRKLKRLLPGRNYTFTARLAKKYGRTFELGDFLAAVKIKKEMDAAYASEDPEKRVYSISRAEPDGAIMAILSLLSEGKVKFISKLPPVNDKFGAPLPRLSVWGFCEGDYVHRGIDRQRLFWDIHVVPTATYDYGNPLQPSSDLPFYTHANSLAPWPALPHPPLPGERDPNALLPIWSTIDGQNITWPWWYRILNLVLQPLIFQPGATVEDIHANCDDYTTEIFEIELVLQWLVSIKAVKKTVGGGYITMPAVWAVFGDTLQGMDDDWLDAHVKRKHQKHKKQQWHDGHYPRNSALRVRNDPRNRSQNDDSDDSDTQTDDSHEATTTASRVMRRPKEQHVTVREQIPDSTQLTINGAVSVEQAAQSANLPELVGNTVPCESVASQIQDVEMRDADENDEMDGEGEMKA